MDADGDERKAAVLAQNRAGGAYGPAMEEVDSPIAANAIAVAKDRFTFTLKDEGKAFLTSRLHFSMWRDLCDGSLLRLKTSLRKRVLHNVGGPYYVYLQNPSTFAAAKREPEKIKLADLCFLSGRHLLTAARLLWDDLKDSSDGEEQATVADLEQQLSAVTVVVINVGARSGGTDLPLFSRVLSHYLHHVQERVGRCSFLQYARGLRRAHQISERGGVSPPALDAIKREIKARGKWITDKVTDKWAKKHVGIVTSEDLFFQAAWELETFLVSRAPDNDLESGHLAVRALVKLHQLFTRHSRVLLDSILACKEYLKNADDVENKLEQYFNEQLPLRMVSELVEEHKPPLPQEQKNVMLEVTSRRRIAAIVEVRGGKATTKEQLKDSLQWRNLKRYARHRAAVAAGDRQVPNLPYEKPHFEKLTLCVFDGGVPDLLDMLYYRTAPRAVVFDLTNPRDAANPEVFSRLLPQLLRVRPDSVCVVIILTTKGMGDRLRHLLVASPQIEEKGGSRGARKKEAEHSFCEFTTSTGPLPASNVDIVTLFFKEHVPEGGKALFDERLPARNAQHYCNDPGNADNAVFGLPRYILDVFTAKLGEKGLTIAAAGNIAEPLGELFFQRLRVGHFRTARCTVFTTKLPEFKRRIEGHSQQRLSFNQEGHRRSVPQEGKSGEPDRSGDNEIGESPPEEEPAQRDPRRTPPVAPSDNGRPLNPQSQHRGELAAAQEPPFQPAQQAMEDALMCVRDVSSAGTEEPGEEMPPPQDSDSEEQRITRKRGREEAEPVSKSKRTRR